MEAKQTIAALGALAHETRLAAFRLLVQRGPDGLSAGTIAHALELSPSSLTFHLQQLTHAGLITKRRISRQLIYATDFAVMNALMGYLTENCCGSGAAVCAPVCHPGATASATPPEKKSAEGAQSMDNSQIKEMVRARYGGIAAAADASDCCTPAASSCSGPTTAALDKALRMGYTEAQLASVPDGVNLGLGCGNPQAIAQMQPGETVVDLGSGAGFDCFLAAQQVGPEGHVIGVDMTHEMLMKARDNAAKIGAGNVEFRLGELEHLPVADNAADVVISNCVINLVPDKAQVLREAFRALKPGGRLAVSDIVSIAPLPAELAADPALICGCVAGAGPISQIEDQLAAAGFFQIAIEVKPYSRELIKSWGPEKRIENYVASATIEARKPAA